MQKRLTRRQEEEVLDEGGDEMPRLKMNKGAEEVEAVSRQQRNSNVSECLVVE